MNFDNLQIPTKEEINKNFNKDSRNYAEKMIIEVVENIQKAISDCVTSIQFVVGRSIYSTNIFIDFIQYLCNVKGYNCMGYSSIEKRDYIRVTISWENERGESNDIV